MARNTLMCILCGKETEGLINIDSMDKPVCSGCSETLTKQFLFDAVKAMQRDNEELERNYHDLAQNLVYEGNSVYHWRQKALLYRKALGETWEALSELGINPDGKTSIAEAIRRLKSERTR